MVQEILQELRQCHITGSVVRRRALLYEVQGLVVGGKCRLTDAELAALRDALPDGATTCWWCVARSRNTDPLGRHKLIFASPLGYRAAAKCVADYLPEQGERFTLRVAAPSGASLVRDWEKYVTQQRFWDSPEVLPLLTAADVLQVQRKFSGCLTS